ncbi:hypothetical protein EJB05_37519, partial [Eragrostis curvula]
MARNLERNRFGGPGGNQSRRPEADFMGECRNDPRIRYGGQQRRPEGSEGRFDDREERQGRFAGGRDERFRSGDGREEREVGNRYQDRREEDLKEEQATRERLQREWQNRKRQQEADDRNYRQSDAGKRRAVEDKGTNYGQVNIGDRTSSSRNIHDRLGSNSGKEDMRPGPGICFWCGQEGHHQAICKNEPFFYRCKDSGHISTNCPASKGCSMHMYGFGVPGHGFYSLKIPGFTTQQPSVPTGLVKIITGSATEKSLAEELKLFIDSNWNWKAKRISEAEFLVVFPSQIILDTFSRGMKLDMNTIKVEVTKTIIDAEASSILQTGWVKFYAIPPMAKIPEAVKLIAELIGEVVVIDELTLIRSGPVRVKLNCRDVSNLRGFIEVFIEKVGYEIRVVAEDFKERASGKNKPDDDKPDESDDDKHNDDEADDLDEAHWKQKKEQQKGKFSNNNNSSTSGTSHQRQKDEEEHDQKTPVEEESNLCTPIATYDPTAEILRVNNQEPLLISWDKVLESKAGRQEGEDELSKEGDKEGWILQSMHLCVLVSRVGYWIGSTNLDTGLYIRHTSRNF